MGKKIRQSPEEWDRRLKATGHRLEEERMRLGLTQERMGGYAQLARRVYFYYECGEREMGILELADLVAAGVDAQYVMTGIKQDAQLSPQELALLQKIRLLPPAIRATHLQMMQVTIEALAQSDAEAISPGDLGSSFTNAQVGQNMQGNIGAQGNNYAQGNHNVQGNHNHTFTLQSGADSIASVDGGKNKK